MDGFVRTKTRLLKRSPLNKISPFSFLVDRIAHMPHMFLEIDERRLNWTSFKKKDVFQKKDVF
jgi:hypothetical protein